jgi:hypothetical protein
MYKLRKSEIVSALSVWQVDVYEGMWHVFQTSQIPENEVLL